MNTTTTMKPSNHKRLSISTRKQSSLSKNQNSHVVWNSIVAGSTAGIMSTSVFYPFEMLRTKMQSAVSDKTTNKAASTRHHGPMELIWRTIRHGGGFRALYTGLSLPLSAQAAYKATVFTVNRKSQELLQEWKTQELYKTGVFGQKYQLTKTDQFWCGAMGGAINGALFVTPVEFVRNQLIAKHTKLTNVAAAAAATSRSSVATTRTSPLSKLSGPIRVLQSTLSKDGLLGLWRGVGITVARDSLGCGLFFFTFHSTQDLLQQMFSSKHFGITLVSGAMSGLGFWTVALPLDTVKTLVQNGTASSASQVVTDLIHKVGPYHTFTRLCRGWQFALGRGAPAAAVTIGTYDSCFRALSAL